MFRRHTPVKIAGLAFCMMAAACLAPALDFSDVQNLLKNQVPEPVIINMTRSDANLAITQEQANQLRSLGASENLIRAIRPANPGAAGAAGSASQAGTATYGQPAYGPSGGGSPDGYEMLYEQPPMDYQQAESAYAQESGAAAYGNAPQSVKPPAAAQPYQQPGSAANYAQPYAGASVAGTTATTPTTTYAAPPAAGVSSSSVPTGPVYYDPNIYYPDGTVVSPGASTVYYESTPGYVVTSPPAVVTTTPTYVYPEYYYDTSPSWGFSIGWGSGWDRSPRYYGGYRGGHRPPPPPRWHGGGRDHRPGPPPRPAPNPTPYGHKR